MQGRTVSCPVCETPISLDPQALLRGVKTPCPRCQTSIALEPGQDARATLERFEQAKREIRAQG